VLIRTDCRHYRVVEPCVPHKQTATRCRECSAYDPVREHILIVKLGAMGDVLRTTSCLPALKKQFPAGRITWVTRPQAAPLLNGNRLVDRVLTIDANYAEQLLAEEFDLTIVPDADPLSVAIGALPRSRARRGFATDRHGGVTPLTAAAEGWWELGLDDTLKRANRQTFGEWLYAICELPLPVAPPVLALTPDGRAAARALLHDRFPDTAHWVGFNTGASARWEEKRWKASHYIELARMLSARTADTRIVLAGGPDEAVFNRELLAAWPAFVDGGTGNSIATFAGIVAECDWMLTGDSLGYHVACAIGTPALCLVGPTAPWELDLFGRNTVVYAPLDCIACYRQRCPFSTTCMDVLTPAVVWDGLPAAATAPAAPSVMSRSC
jgi:heptosyltransferase-2